MMILEGELLLRRKIGKGPLEWVGGYFVLAVEERTLFCFSEAGGLEKPKCVIKLREASVSRVEGSDGAFKFSIVCGGFCSRVGRLYSRALATCCVAVGVLARSGARRGTGGSRCRTPGDTSPPRTS